MGVDGVAIVTTFDALGRKVAMADPDKGVWRYQYNALGELIEQQDANGNVTRFFRDTLGRTVTRAVVLANGDSENTHYQFAGTHQLHREYFTGAPALSQAYTYDAFGRVNTHTTTLDNGQAYTQQTTYDEYGRVLHQFDADNTSALGCVDSQQQVVGVCWGIVHRYNAYGYFVSVRGITYFIGKRPGNYVFYCRSRVPIIHVI